MKTILLTLCAVALPAFSQTGGSTAPVKTLKDTIIQHWKSTAQLTIAVANAMPADSYNFRPNPEEMSFGEVMAHIGAANAGACAVASGQPRMQLPEKLAAWSKDPQKIDVDRETAVKYLTDTFDFCQKAIASIAPDHYDVVVGPPQRNMTAFEWLWSYFTHTAHHRGQAEVYLRVKGITPPTYTF